MTRADWIFRPLLWFVTASTINVLLHEGAHAVTGFSFGMTATLHQYWVDWSGAVPTRAQEAIVGAAGPVCSLVFGLCCGLAYRRQSRTAAGLPLLYLAAFGLAMFFGNLMSAAFVGDFSRASATLGISMPMRYTASAVGVAGNAAALFWLGRELRHWIPDKAGRVFGVIAVTVVPAVAGTALIVLFNLPVPPSVHFAAARFGEAAFHVFAVIGAATGARPSSAGRSFRLRWIDGTIAVAALLVVRIAVLGIHLLP